MKYCSLMSGSWGNCHYISAGETSILIDTGQSGRRILTNMAIAGCEPASSLSAIVITHGHRDHVSGAGVLARKLMIPVYATEGAWFEMGEITGEVPAELRHVINPDEIWSIGGLSLEAFPTSHDALESVGYVVRHGRDAVLGIATDSGVFTNQMERALKQARALALEANHDPEMLRTGKYPYFLKARIAGVNGHMSNEDAGKALRKIGCAKLRKVMLAHLSQENNTREKALSSVKQELPSDNIGRTELYVAPRSVPSEWFTIGG
jgi:phosphoribosyl 1,2-cyclic phosphodiesterase